MPSINFERFARVLHRSAEVAGSATAPHVVQQIHRDQLAEVSGRYATAHGTVVSLQAKEAVARNQARLTLAAIDQPFRVARAALLAYVSGSSVPETLKAQPTDTDKARALGELRTELAGHHGQAWADEQLAGPFGTRAAGAIAALEAVTAAARELAHAREARLAAYQEAYPRYLAFKRVVRESLGSRSSEYHRIHLRATAEATGEVWPPTGELTPAAAPADAPPGTDPVSPAVTA